MAARRIFEKEGEESTRREGEGLTGKAIMKEGDRSQVVFEEESSFAELNKGRKERGKRKTVAIKGGEEDNVEDGEEEEEEESNNDFAKESSDHKHMKNRKKKGKKHGRTRDDDKDHNEIEMSLKFIKKQSQKKKLIIASSFYTVASVVIVLFVATYLLSKRMFESFQEGFYQFDVFYLRNTCATETHFLLLKSLMFNQSLSADVADVDEYNNSGRVFE